MAHCNTVVDGDGVELSSIAAEFFNLLLDNLSYLVEVCMSRNELREGIYYGDDRFAELLTLHTVSNPKSSRSSHAAAFCADRTSKLVFHIKFKCVILRI